LSALFESTGPSPTHRAKYILVDPGAQHSPEGISGAVWQTTRDSTVVKRVEQYGTGRRARALENAGWTLMMHYHKQLTLRCAWSQVVGVSTEALRA
jgi:hypothetical protein